MSSRASPEDQTVTFVELFFDLVFVFSVTQVVGLFHHHISLGVVAQAVLVFWLVWWAWTQFTWALNAADTNHHWIQVFTLVATGVAFFMAVALPDAFHGRAIWFAIPYVLVRTIGLGVYAWVASENEAQHKAVKGFAAMSIGGIVAVLAGAIVGGTAQYYLWAIAIVLDLMAATVAGRSDGWDIHADHFSERHGLFVIIALGETLIVAASGLKDVELTGSILVVAPLIVAVACGLWWIYFTRFKPQLDRALELVRGAKRATMARDAYTFGHFPILCGIVAFAVVIEHVVAHPSDSLPTPTRLMLGASIVLYAGGIVLAFWRATQRILVPRLILAVVTLAVVMIPARLTPQLALGAGVITIVIIASLEHRMLGPEETSELR